MSTDKKENTTKLQMANLQEDFLAMWSNLQTTSFFSLSFLQKRTK